MVILNIPKLSVARDLKNQLTVPFFFSQENEVTYYAAMEACRVSAQWERALHLLILGPKS